MVDLITENLELWSSTYLTKKTVGRGSNSQPEAYGIKKLRELILELAVRGKLVPQDPNDEPASILLEKIETEKEKLIKEKKIKKQKALSPISDEEKPFELPRSWGYIRFGEVLDFSGGSQPPKSTFSDTRLEGYVQLIQIRDLGPSPQPVYVPKESVSKFCSPDDVMIGRYGASVGKVFWGKDGAYNVALIKLHNDLKAYTKEFLFLLMLSPVGQSLFMGISRSAQAGFSKGDIEDKILPILSHNEQHRIVAKVDELMALCDRLEAQQTDSIEAHQTLVETLLKTLTSSKDPQEFQENWNRIAEHFDTLFTADQSIETLKQTILQLSVMGMLVPQNPNDEPGNILLEKIEAEKERLVKEGKIKKQKKLPEISEDEKPFEVPNGWVWARLGQLCTKLTDGSHNPPKNAGSGFPMLSSQNVNYGKIDFSNPSRYVSLEDFEKEDQRTQIKPNDVLLTIVASLGRSAVVPQDAPQFVLQRSVAVLQSNLNSKFLALQLVAPTCLNYYDTHGKGTAQKGIYLGKLSLMEMAVPPLHEQDRIVAKVDELMALCDTLQKQLEAVQSTQIHLADAIVEQAVK